MGSSRQISPGRAAKTRLNTNQQSLTLAEVARVCCVDDLGCEKRQQCAGSSGVAPGILVRRCAFVCDRLPPQEGRAGFLRNEADSAE